MRSAIELWIALALAGFLSLAHFSIQAPVAGGVFFCVAIYICYLLFGDSR